MRSVNHHGSANPRWKGGRRVAVDGYVLVHAPDHHRAGKRAYTAEHVLVAERALGRPIHKRHQIHHVNGDRADNRPLNLVVCEDAAYHKLLHRRSDALRECGNASWLRCRFCGKHGDPLSQDMYVHPSGARGAHRTCRRAYRKARRQITGRWS